MYPYQDKTRDIRSNIHLCLKEFPRANPEGTPEGKGVYLTVYYESSPNMYPERDEQPKERNPRV